MYSFSEFLKIVEKIKEEEKEQWIVELCKKRKIILYINHPQRTFLALEDGVMITNNRFMIYEALKKADLLLEFAEYKFKHEENLLNDI